MFVQAFRQLFQDFCQDMRPRPPRGAVPLTELNKACGMLLQGCRSKDAGVAERARAALKHASAARTLAELGYPAGVVNMAARQALVAVRG